MPDPNILSIDDGSLVVSQAAIPQDRALVLSAWGLSLLVFQYRNSIHAYVNRCPHIGTPLDLVSGKIFSRDGQELICATHGARFLPSTGLCIAGPCQGRSLQALSIKLAGSEVVLARPD